MKDNDTMEKVEIEFHWKKLSNFLLLILELGLETWQQKFSLAMQLKSL